MATINNPVVLPEVRQIRCWALFDGKRLPGLYSFSWTESSHYTPATFTATFATNADKAFTAKWWDKRDTGMTIELWLSVERPASPPIETMIGIGLVDTHTLSASMTTVEVQGRDLAALMIDQRTAETFQNKTASEIVTEIAGRHGLTADVTVTTTSVGQSSIQDLEGRGKTSAKTRSSATTAAQLSKLRTAADSAAKTAATAVTAAQTFPSDATSAAADKALAKSAEATAALQAATAPVGRYWGDHTSESRAQNASTTTEWDILVRIAQTAGFDLYMKGRTLHFHPAIDPDSTPWMAFFRPADSVYLNPLGNIHDLTMTRRFTLAKTVTVIVKSFNSRLGKAVSASASFGATTTDTSIGGAHGTTKVRPTRYTYVRANLTQDQAQKMADRLLNDIVKHERTINFSAPGDIKLNPRVMVRLDGTGTDFDQVYYIDSITKNVSFDTGFSMDVMAKNHSPSSNDATSE